MARKTEVWPAEILVVRSAVSLSLVDNHNHLSKMLLIDKQRVPRPKLDPQPESGIGSR